MISIYQMHLSDEEIDTVNAHGWKSVPKADAYLSAQMGKFKEEYLPFYEKTFDVHTDNLDEVFRETNLWNQQTPVIQHRRGHSSSMGDIFVNETGEAFVVARFGFDKIGDNIFD